jgi:hypothetical protein
VLKFKMASNPENDEEEDLSSNATEDTPAVHDSQASSMSVKMDQLIERLEETLQQRTDPKDFKENNTRV